MHTLFDFVSKVNAAQYVLMLLFILGFIIFSEIFNPRPFRGLLKSLADDFRFIRTQDNKKFVQVAKNIALAPFYTLIYLIAVPVLFYIAAVPILFFKGMSVSFDRLVVSATSARWSPVRAYFTGRKGMKRITEDNRKQRDLDDETRKRKGTTNKREDNHEIK
ncbi:MAG: hypothetical protein ACLPX5_05070 [Dissulfurispiraceae bacterium]